MYVSQLFHSEGGLITCEDSCCFYNFTVMKWNSLITAIPKEWKTKLMSQISFMPAEDKYERFLQKLKTVKFYYDFILRERNNMKKIEFKWRKETKVNMQVEDLLEGFQDLYVVTNQARLCSFQYRILHRAIILNDRMFKWGKLDNDLCTSCQSKKETYHFFWECEIFQKVIGWVRKMCEEIDNQQNVE